jgi:hypothetical protein
MSLEICTSHFNEDLGWLQKSPWPVIVVHHEGGTPVECAYTIPNVGFEVTSYLKYIIERYDSLPDHVAFIHGHETAFHQHGDRPMLDMIKTANIQKYDYIPLNNCWRCVNSTTQMSDQLISAQEHGFPKIPDHFITCCGAQFIVSKKAIVSNSKEKYQYWYSVANGKSEAILFELIWHSIFGCGPSIIPYIDHFTPKMSEILYSDSGSIPMVLSKFKPCYIGDYPPIGLIHITNQSEYDYYNIRGGTFFARINDPPNVDFTFDVNKLSNIEDKHIIVKNIYIFEEIMNTLISDDRTGHA